MGSGASRKYEAEEDEGETDGEEAADAASKAKKNDVSPPAQVLKTDYSSKIHISLRAEALADGRSTFVVVYTKLLSESFWRELGVTEICSQDTLWPIWEKFFELEFKVEMIRQVRCEVYKVRKPHMMEDLMEQKYIGCLEFTVTDALMARAKEKTCGWYVKKLQDFRKKKGDVKTIGRLAVYAEEVGVAKQELIFSVRMAGIGSPDYFKRMPDPYYIINRTEIDDENDDFELQLLPCFRSEVGRRSVAPKFKSTVVTAPQLCGADLQKDIIITVYDWYRLSEDRYIGEVVTNFEEIQKAAARGKSQAFEICWRKGPRIHGMTRLPYAALKKHIRSKSKSKSSGSKSTGSRSDSNSRDRSRSPIGTKESPGGTRTASKLSNNGRSSSRDSGVRASTKGSSSTLSSGGSEKTGLSSSLSSKISGLTGQSQGSANAKFGPVVGSLLLEDFGTVHRNSFLDYVRGGLEMRLMLGIDFTRSNIGQNNPDSLHCMTNEGEESQYAQCIRAVGEIMKSYDNDDMYPVYGFGAKIPPSHTVTSNCFALTGDFFKPEVFSVEGILTAYKRALAICELHGPSRCSDVIDLCKNIARPYVEVPEELRDPREKPPEQKYFVMLILTDGEIVDQERTIREIRSLAELPISIIFIGIGTGEFTFLRSLKSDLQELAAKDQKRIVENRTEAANAAARHSKNKKEDPSAQAMPERRQGVRNLIHFVKFNDYIGDPSGLATACLADLPKEIIVYYNMLGIKPRGLSKFEDAAGNPKPKEIPSKALLENQNSRKTKAKKVEDTSTARNGTKGSGGSGSREGTKETRRSSTRSMSGSRTSVREGSSSPSSGSEKMSRSGSNTTASSKPLSLHGFDFDEDEEEEEPESEESEEEEEGPAVQNDDTLPIFLLQEKERIMDDCTRLGYDKNIVTRVLRDGVPSSSLDVVIDNIMNTGYGKFASYKSMAEEAIPDAIDPNSKSASKLNAAQAAARDTTDYAAELQALSGQTKEKQDQMRQQSNRMASLGITSRSRTILSATSALSGAGSAKSPQTPKSQESQKGSGEGPGSGKESPTTLLSSRRSSRDMMPGIRDGSAVRTLLEEASSRDASRRVSKDDRGSNLNPDQSQAGSGARTTSKTLEEVAGKLQNLPSRTKSKGEGGGGRRPSLTTTYEAIAEEPEVDGSRSRTQSDMLISSPTASQDPISPPAAKPPALGPASSSWRPDSKDVPSTAAPSKSEPPDPDSLLPSKSAPSSQLPSKSVPPGVPDDVLE